MRKIKFKTEYVPLSDEVINRHKNFDLLMGAYVAAPKPNWFKKFIQKKWTMFGGGLMTGAIITSLLWYSQDIATVEQPVVQQTTTVNEVQEAGKNNTAAIFDSSLKNNEVTTAKGEVAVNPEVVPGKMEAPAGETESSITKKSATSTVAAGNSNKLQQQKAVSINEANGISEANNNKPAFESEKNVQITENPVSVQTKSEEIIAANLLQENEKLVNENKDQVEIIAESKQEMNTPVADFGVIQDSISKDAVVIMGPPEYTPAIDTNDQHAASEKDEKNDIQLPALVAGAAVLTPPAIGSLDPSAKSEKEKKDIDKQKKNLDKDSSAFSFLSLKLFNRDTSKNEELKDQKKGWFVFGKDSTEKNLSSGSLKDSINIDNAPHDVNQDSLYIPRYAQVSFVTPLSSNGIDGYKYMHYVSLNVLQGYNGAVKGAEFGGLLNGVKGYVTGAQFAGLGNYAGGNLKGAQFGGLVNVSESVRGAQFGGITNVSGSFVSGFQAAGVVNVAPDSLNGLQIAGVVNVLGSERKSESWQVAGVGNVSLAQSKGAQIGGVFNVANDLAGGQIGLINFGKSIKGFQIGLINISDTIDGVPIGLISVSANGVFDANIWTSDFLAFNGGVRVGSKYVYNIYAYGVSPFNDDLPFGFGIGIGGHIPIKRAFIDIDGMAWSMHHSYISFAEINMINQLRVMGGFTINKYLSIFAGPTLNISVQDNRYDPFLNNYFFENVSENTTVRMAPGFVAGIRLF